MRTLAKGKVAVLAHLEHDATNRTGKPGAYRIIGDDSGNAAFVIIAGHIFSGSPTLPADLPSDIAALRAENGIIVDIGE
jgi:hypothetical protein